MNLVDYLYGGGEGKIGISGYFVLFWGILVKGYKMRKKKVSDKFIIFRKKYK